MITADELGTISSEIERVSLPDAAVLTAPTRTQTAMGYTDVWATVWTGTGRIAAIEQRELELAQRIEAVGSWVATLPKEAPATAAMRLTMLGRTFEITAVLNIGTYDLYTRLLCAEVG